MICFVAPLDTELCGTRPVNKPTALTISQSTARVLPKWLLRNSRPSTLSGKTAAIYYHRMRYGVVLSKTVYVLRRESIPERLTTTCRVDFSIVCQSMSVTRDGNDLSTSTSILLSTSIIYIFYIIIF